MEKQTLYEAIGRNVVQALRSGGRLVLDVGRFHHEAPESTDSSPMIITTRRISERNLAAMNEDELAAYAIRPMSEELRDKMAAEKHRRAQLAHHANTQSG